MTVTKVWRHEQPERRTPPREGAFARNDPTHDCNIDRTAWRNCEDPPTVPILPLRSSRSGPTVPPLLFRSTVPFYRPVSTVPFLSCSGRRHTARRANSDRQHTALTNGGAICSTAATFVHMCAAHSCVSSHSPVPHAPVSACSLKGGSIRVALQHHEYDACKCPVQKSSYMLAASVTMTLPSDELHATRSNNKSSYMLAASVTMILPSDELHATRSNNKSSYMLAASVTTTSPSDELHATRSNNKSSYMLAANVTVTLPSDELHATRSIGAAFESLLFALDGTIMKIMFVPVSACSQHSSHSSASLLSTARS